MVPLHIVAGRGAPGRHAEMPELHLVAFDEQTVARIRQRLTCRLVVAVGRGCAVVGVPGRQVQQDVLGAKGRRELPDLLTLRQMRDQPTLSRDRCTWWHLSK